MLLDYIAVTRFLTAVCFKSGLYQQKNYLRNPIIVIRILSKGRIKATFFSFFSDYNILNLNTFIVTTST